VYTIVWRVTLTRLWNSHKPLANDVSFFHSGKHLMRKSSLNRLKSSRAGWTRRALVSIQQHSVSTNLSVQIPTGVEGRANSVEKLNSMGSSKFHAGLPTNVRAGEFVQQSECWRRRAPKSGGAAIGSRSKRSSLYNTDHSALNYSRSARSAQ